jgi:hypothetical protein
MKKETALGIILTLYTSFLMGASWADTSFRCNRKIINIGDTTGEVLMKCGEPTYRDIVGSSTSGTYSEDTQYNGMEASSSGGGYHGRTVNREIWIYDFGPRKFIRVLTFSGGRLIAIENGPYGNPP